MPDTDSEQRAESVRTLEAEVERLWDIVKRHNEECVPLWERQNLHVGHAQPRGSGESQLGLNVFCAKESVEQNLAGTPVDGLHPVGGGLLADGTSHASQYGARRLRLVDGQTALIDGSPGRGDEAVAGSPTPGPELHNNGDGSGSS